MQPQLGIWKRFIISLSGVDICSLSWGSGRGLLEVYQWWKDANSAGNLEEVDQNFISGWRESADSADLEEAYYNFQWWTNAASAGNLEEVYQKFSSGGQMQTQLGMWKRFIRSLLGVDRCIPSAGDLDEVYQKFISGGQMQPQMGIWKRFIRSLPEVNRCSLSLGFGRG